MVHTIIPDILVMHIEPAQLIYFPANSSKLHEAVWALLQDQDHYDY